MPKKVLIAICKSLTRIENLIYVMLCSQYGELKTKKAYNRISKNVDKNFEKMEEKNDKDV